MLKTRALPAFLATLLVAAAAMLSGCGQTGALYFDEAPPADQLPPSKKSAPVSVQQTGTDPIRKPADEQSKMGSE